MPPGRRAAAAFFRARSQDVMKVLAGLDGEPDGTVGGARRRPRSPRSRELRRQRARKATRQSHPPKPPADVGAHRAGELGHGCTSIECSIAKEQKEEGRRVRKGEGMW